MKKLTYILFFVLASSVCMGQNPEINFSLVHSPEGKEWKRMLRLDGDPESENLQNEKYVFYSNGDFVIKQSNANARAASSSPKKWSYNERNSTLSWTITSPTGITKKYNAQITYIEEGRMVVNLSENENDSRTVVYIAE